MFTIKNFFDKFSMKSVEKFFFFLINDPKFSDRYAWANSADPDQSDQGLHCLPFCLHCLDSLLCGKAT